MKQQTTGGQQLVHVAVEDQVRREGDPGSRSNLRQLIVEGDGMAPGLRSGDVVLVDRSTRAHCDGLYVIRMGEAILIKQLQHLLDGVRVSSWNKVYEPFTVPAEQLDIIGRVVWTCRRL